MEWKGEKAIITPFEHSKLGSETMLCSPEGDYHGEATEISLFSWDRVMAYAQSLPHLSMCAHAHMA